MNFKDYLIVMSLASVAAWIAWLVVLVSIDPTRTSQMGFVFFYVTLAIALTGTLSIAGAGIRTWAKKDELVSRHVSISLRQSILFTGLVLGSIFLLSLDLFTWLTAMLLIIILALIELIFLSASRQTPSFD
jgi:hypothetical protein